MGVKPFSCLACGLFFPCRHLRHYLPVAGLANASDSDLVDQLVIQLEKLDVDLENTETDLQDSMAQLQETRALVARLNSRDSPITKGSPRSKADVNRIVGIFGNDDKVGAQGQKVLDSLHIGARQAVLMEIIFNDLTNEEYKLWKSSVV